jgi:branched-chain amino acid transport system substrate-binding protein
VKNRILVGSALGTVLVGVILAVTVGGAFARSTGATPLPAATCSAIQNPSGNLLISSDLPLLGAARTQTVQMTKAIAFVFSQAGWKAGNYTIAYQSCNDATAQAGAWDSGTCSTNASSYAQDSSVVGVIGTFNSGCAEIEIPIENRAPNGPLAMVSPANTYVGLTHAGKGTAAGEPGKYYPTGKRNYARVVAADDYQGAADATLAQKLGIKKLFILNDKQAYGAGVAGDMQGAATALGIKVLQNEAWDAKATSYSALALSIKASGAQAVFLGGLICENGGELIKDIRDADSTITILAPDGFTPVSSVVQEAGTATNGMYVSVAGLPVSELPPAGKAFVSAFDKTIGGALVQPYSVYAAQVADVYLKAIAASDGTRAGVASEIFKVNIPNGILGPIAFNANGDVSSGPVSEYKVVNGQQTTYTVIRPAANVVKAA